MNQFGKTFWPHKWKALTFVTKSHKIVTACQPVIVLLGTIDYLLIILERSYFLPSYKWWKGGSERLHNMPVVTQLRSEGTRIEPRLVDCKATLSTATLCVLKRMSLQEYYNCSHLQRCNLDVKIPKKL